MRTGGRVRLSTAQELAGGMGGHRRQRGNGLGCSGEEQTTQVPVAQTVLHNLATADGALVSLALWHADGDEAPAFHHNGRSKLLQN
jgi:hypothetical protein